MYIFLKRLLRELFTVIIVGKADKIYDDELIDDEKITKKYGSGTYILNIHDTEQTLASYELLRIFLLILEIVSIVAMILLAMCGVIFEPGDRWGYIFIPFAYIFLLTLTKIGKNIYKSYKNIVTKENIIIRRAYKKDRIVTYEEISEAAKKKKIVIKKVVMYIPTSKKPLRVEILGNIYGELALERIKQKSKISIPEITEKRKKYMGQASMSGLFNFFSYLLLLMALIGAADHYDNVIVGYFTRLVTQEYCILLLALGIGVLIIGKIYFMFGQYKLRKDINDPEHVRIRL